MHFEFLPILGALVTTAVISMLIRDWLPHPSIDGRTCRRGPQDQPAEQSAA